MLIKKLNYNIKQNEQHPFHLVDVSPWPIMTAISLFSLTLSFLMYFNYFNNGLTFFYISFTIFLFYLWRWFTDIVEEATFEGHHTHRVQRGVRMGMALFIVSEIMFFFSFFWAFFHGSLSAAIDIGCIWPPQSINPLDPWGLPLLNTIILLSSGVTITWAHRAILSGNWLDMTNGLSITIFYGLLFTAIQYYEYTVAPFCINDSIFGSLFFMLTGFHGCHVLIGTIFLIVCLYRHLKLHFSINHHVGFECAIWYWHFVDGVGTKQVLSRFLFKRQISIFGCESESTLRRIIGFVSQVLLLEQKSFAVEVSNSHVSMKSFTKTVEPTNRFPSKLSSSLIKESQPYGMSCYYNISKFKVYSNQKVTGNIHSCWPMCTIGKPMIYEVGTVAETRKYFSSTSGEKNNESALKKTVLSDKDESEEEYINFIKNDESLFERAISSASLKRAWYQLKSKPGMLTKNTGKETLSGISEAWFKTTSTKLLNGSFSFPKRRRVNIPKKSKGERPLTIANPRVKVIEKAILNALEPQFEGYTRLEQIDSTEYVTKDKKFIEVVDKKSNTFIYFKKVTIIKRVFFPHSYGFRPNKSAHECLNNIKHWRNTTVYLLDYDIRKAFDEINRKRMKNILNNYIKDKKFWTTLNKLLSAGVEDDIKTIIEYKGVAQGSVLSPFLFNVYLHELDKFIVGLQIQASRTRKEYVSNLYRHEESESNYKKISREWAVDRWKSTLKKYGTVEKVIQARRLTYKEHHDKYRRRKGVDPDVRYIHYVRYADDFLIGIVGSRSFAIQVQKDINNFIKGNLHLDVKKDLIVHRNQGAIEFLGHDIKLQQFKKKYNALPKAIRAAKQHKKKTLARFAQVDKRLARAKSNQYRANILKQINNICSTFDITAKKRDTDIISRTIALKAVIKQVSKALNFSEPNKFLKLLMENTNIDSAGGKSNSALLRWEQIYQKEADRLTEFARRIQSDMLSKTTSEFWEASTKKSIADQLTAIQTEFIAKTEEVTNQGIDNICIERRNKVSAKHNIPKETKERSEIDKNLLELADSMSLELLKKEGHRRISVNARIKECIDRLRLAGFVHPFKSKASGNAKLNFLRDDEIVKKFNSTIYGLLNWYSGAGNFIKVKGLAMLLRKSCALTLSNKHKKSVFWVYSTYGSEIQIPIGPKQSVNLITRHEISNFKTGFKLKSNQNLKVFWDQVNSFHSTSHSLTYLDSCSVLGCKVTKDIEVTPH